MIFKYITNYYYFFVLLKNLNKIYKEIINKWKQNKLRKSVQKSILAVPNFQGVQKKSLKN